MPRDYVRVSFIEGPSGGNYVGGEYGFSKVIDPNNPDPMQRNIPPRRASYAPAVPENDRFVPLDDLDAEAALIPGAYIDPDRPELGYIVDGEDESILRENGFNSKQIEEKIKGQARIVSDRDVEKMMEQEARQRAEREFDDLIGEIGMDSYEFIRRFEDLGL